MELRNEIEIKYHAILNRARGLTFSQREAAKLVGGLGRLKNLIVKDEIHFGQGSKATAWRLDAVDVLRHCKVDSYI